MKILVVGDTHGNYGEVDSSFMRARAREVDAIVQVGDFGYWEHADEGGFVDYVSMWSNKTGIPLFWIDGNHENHTLLRSKYADAPKTPEGAWIIRDGCNYIPRGLKWEWDGVTFMGVGGAVSIDKDYRLARERGEACPMWGHYIAEPPTGPETMWWPDEQLTDEEVAYVKTQGHADVLFTHDCPPNAPFKHRLKEDLESQIHRQRMAEVGKSVQPRLWFHGHMHELYNYTFRHDAGEAHVIGLECDNMTSNWCFFDTATVFDNVAAE